MTARLFVRAATGVFALLGPAAALAQEVVVNHQEIKCIVAGTFPRMDACFTPPGMVGKARVYFRPETLPTWFYVDMAADAACHAGVLPRPSKKLIDKKVFYYLDVQGKGTARTPEYAPVVVAREEDCKNVPAAPAAATGPAAVYPSLPAGFGGAGVSGAVLAAGVAGILVTGGAAVLPGGSEDPRAPMPTTPPVTNPPAAPPPTIPPGTLPPGLQPLVVACEANPRSGEAPLRVAFATFPSGGTGSYEFLWSFGDGGLSPNPNPAYVYQNDGVFEATVRVTSGNQVALCTRTVTVGRIPEIPPSPSPSASPTPIPGTFRLQVGLVGSGTGRVTGPGINCPTDCDETYPAGTVVTLIATPAGAPATVFDKWTGHCIGNGPCTVTMDANRNVVAHFERAWSLTVRAGFVSDVSGTLTSNPAGIACAWPPGCVSTASFVNGTTVTLTVNTTGLTFLWGGACAGAIGPVCTVLVDADKAVTLDTLRMFNGGNKVSAAPLALTSQLEVPGGEGQVVVNGRRASAVPPGVIAIAAERQPGSNLVEAVLVRAAGRPGRWRLDLGGHASVQSGSLRVIAGTVAVLAGDSVVFQLQGKPGERIAFTFQIDE